MVRGLAIIAVFVAFLVHAAVLAVIAGIMVWAEFTVIHFHMRTVRLHVGLVADLRIHATQRCHGYRQYQCQTKNVL